MTKSQVTEQRAEDICAQEPIERPDAIQPHGWLIVVRQDGHQIESVSANIEELFAEGATAMTGQPADQFLDQLLLDACVELSAASTRFHFSNYVGRFNIGDLARLYDVSSFVHNDLVHIEIEPASPMGARALLLASIHRAVSQSSDLDDLPDLFRQITVSCQALTGFDRVMVYQFLPDNSGVVLEESLKGKMEPWLGQRYPASDIPPQARALYVLNRLRVIPNTTYTAVPLVHATPATVLEMRYNALRSVSPVHRKYLQNMEVGASMSISIVCQNKLWGMILFQHPEPVAVSAEMRTGLSLIGSFVSAAVAVRVAGESQRKAEKTGVVLRAIELLGRSGSLLPVAALLERVIENDGVVLKTARADWGSPKLDVEDQASLDAWLGKRDAGHVHVANDGTWRATPRDGHSPTGVLAIRANAADWIIFLRNACRDVNWAGIPEKNVETGPNGEVRIAPRADFSVWKELRRNTNEAWTDDELAIARKIQQHLANIQPG